MVRAIRDYFERTGYAVGFKPAGGIRTAKKALDWLALMKEELGDRWLQPDLFRFGASALLTDIERQLEHFVTGRYSAAHRHPMAVTCTSRSRPHEPTSPRSSRPWSTARRPRAAEPAHAWLDAHDRRVRALHRRRLDAGRRRDLRRRSTRPRAKPLAHVAAGHRSRRRRAPSRRRARRCRRGRRSAATAARATCTRSRAQVQKHSAPARRARDAGQRQADPRDARHRRAARRAALLPPRRLGAAHGAASSPATSRSAWSGRSSRGTSRC